MTAVSNERIKEVAEELWLNLYEEPFRGKPRGRFCLTREQLKRALGVERLHASTIGRLQDEALSVGLIIIDLDDLFPCVEKAVVRRYRRPPEDVFSKFFAEDEPNDTSEEDEED